MKTLSTYVNESLTKSEILSHKYDVSPADWNRFTGIAKSSGFKIGLDDDGDQIVYNSSEVIARFDEDTLEVYTNIEKVQFFKVAAHSNKGILTKLFNL
jgi:hypothetical protein